MNEQFETVEHGTEKYWVSLVGWGFIKRKLYSPKNLNRFRFPSFVPFCEMAVFTNSPSTGKPAIAVIYFSSTEGGKNCFPSIIKTLHEQGIVGVFDYIKNIKFSDYKEFGNIG